MNYKVLIVKDEPLLKRQIKELQPTLNSDNGLRPAAEKTTWLKNNSYPALIFMDIQLTDGVSFSTLDQTEISKKVRVCKTAYNENAIEAFGINSIACLLNSIRDDELKNVFAKQEKAWMGVDNRLTSPPMIDYSRLAKEVTRQQNKFRKRILVGKASSYRQIPVDSIAYFRVEGKITMAVTFKNRQHIIDWTLSDLQEELNPDDFLRMNRQFIVNLNAIGRVKNYINSKLIIKLIPGLETPERIVVSREKANLVKNWLDR
jgi:DNA-binding LytR/AlgR family response regulator